MGTMMRLAAATVLLAACIDSNELSGGIVGPPGAVDASAPDVAMPFEYPPATDLATPPDFAVLDLAPPPDLAPPSDLVLTGTAYCKAIGASGGCGTAGLYGHGDGGCVCDDGKGTPCGPCDCSLVNGSMCVDHKCTKWGNFPLCNP